MIRFGSTSMLKALFILLSAETSLAQSPEAEELPQREEANATTAERAPAEESEGRSLPSSRPSALAVRIQLSDTDLSEERIKKALADELQLPVVRADGPQGLLLVIRGRELEASFVDEEGQRIERTIELPENPERQLDAVALLSGNLARDEAGELLAELRTESDEDATLPSAIEEAETPERVATPNPAPNETDESTASAEEAAADEVDSDDPPIDKKAHQKTERAELPVERFSFALWGNVTFPRDLDRKKTNIHLGAFHSDIGSLEGFAGNLFVLRNRGRGQNEAGLGMQGALIWAHSDGYFRGLHASAIAATAQGGIEGVQGSAIASYQKNETKGAQLAGIATVAMSDVEGAQGGGAFAGTWGDIEGVQGAGGVALIFGDLEGAQLATGLAAVSGSVEGFQMGAITFSRSLRGMQLGLANVAYEKMDGLQLGIGNYAGAQGKTQIGLLNIGGQIKGSQIGLLNIAADVDGAAVAPVNIIPSIRNQVVSYVSWAPGAGGEATAAGPLVHAGVKFMPDPFYSQLTFGLGAEAEECPEGASSGDSTCVGNGVLYAPGLAMGGRARLSGGLFLEVDGQYQFEKAFGSSSAHGHAGLGRFALGYEWGEAFSVVAGGGPRVDLRVDRSGRVDPNPDVSPHVFAGIQVF